MGTFFISARSDASSCAFPVWTMAHWECIVPPPDDPLDQCLALPDGTLILLLSFPLFPTPDAPEPTVLQYFSRPAHVPADWHPELGAAAIPVYQPDAPVYVPLIEDVPPLSEAVLQPAGGLAAFRVDDLFSRLISSLRSIRACLRPLLRQGPPATWLSARALGLTTVQVA